MTTTTDDLRILCVDDHAFLVAGLRSVLGHHNGMEVVGELSSVTDLRAEVERTGAQVVLLDIEMPGPDPFEAIEELSRRAPDVRVVILSAHVRDCYLQAAVEAGAWGYLSKGDAPAEILEGIRRVSSGKLAFSPEVEGRVWATDYAAGRREVRLSDGQPASRLGALSTRERQVLRMIGRGLSRVDIARELFRSPKTIDSHQASIMGKLDIHDRTELVRYAIREGLVEP